MTSARKPAIDTCNACGKLFPRVAMRLCASCSLAEQNRFELVRQFLDAHGGGSVADIAKQTGVSANDVSNFLERGRLVTVRGGSSGDGCTCENSGRCDACHAQMNAGLRMAHERRRAI